MNKNISSTNTNTTNTSSTNSSSSSSNASNKSGVSASATNASNLLNGDSINLSLMQAQLLECLEKLDFILANQQRLESQLAAHGIILSVSQQTQNASIDA